MPIDLTNTEAIDPNDENYATMLTNLQGNILKGHGREHTVHIFLHFRGNAAYVRQHLAPIANQVVTSALQQHIETKQFKQFHVPGALFGNVFLTASGYKALGYTQEQLDEAFSEPRANFEPNMSFLQGMRANGVQELNDPDPKEWEEGYRKARIDAMILLADDDEAYLLREARTLINKLERFATVLVVERGTALRNDEGEGIEHFGYVDGRSQPLFFKGDLADETHKDVWNPFAPLKLVLVPDKTVPDDDAFGSYFVFRKLEQDVRRFIVREHELADALGLVEDDRERAGAMAVGRFRDGTPLVLSQTDGFIPAKENNFTYEGDAGGLKCPFHAHIRKANPRGDIVRGRELDEEEAERSRRIARRGITYGQRNRNPNAFQSLDDLPTKDVGLLFMCFQANIAKQFAFMQKLWVNNAGFVKEGVGVDPIIAQPGEQEAAAQQWQRQWGQAASEPFSFGHFVTLKGGEFFFTPSIPFLKNLVPPVEYASFS